MRPEEIRQRLAAHEPVEIPALPGRRNHLRAGVLVPVAWTPDPCLILTLRPLTMKHHAGEVSFPGGKPEAGDEDLWATARREAREELGLRSAELLGRLSSIPLFTSDYRLEPFVAAVDPAELSPDPREVERVLRMPLFPEEIDGLTWEWNGEQQVAPVFMAEGRKVYGGTAYAILELLKVLGRPPRVVTGRMDWGALGS